MAFSRTPSQFSIRRGFAGHGYILGEYGFRDDPREMAFSDRAHLEREISIILDSWEEDEESK